MIYFDNHATTVCDPRVLNVMLPFFSTKIGNTSSSHYLGQVALDEVNRSAFWVSKLLNGQREEILFTSGATESNNISILGITKQKFSKSNKRKIFTTTIEHKSVLEPILQLKKAGWEIVFLPVDQSGRVELHTARNLISDDAFLLSVQLANSEIGTIQPIKELAEIAHSKGAFVHCDASQGVGKVAINVNDFGVDLLSISGHKLHGPQGIGALWIKKGIENLMEPILYGGGSDKSLRPGTKPLPLIVGLGQACKIAVENLFDETMNLAEMRDNFEKFLKEKIPEIIINGSLENRLPNNSNVTFPNLDAEALLFNMPEVIASTGSACESGSMMPSRVLTSIGLSDERAYQTVRFGFSRFNKLDEVIKAIDIISKKFYELRETVG